jgi:hypothetical protein
MREINSNQDANLAALSEINHSLRQQVIELVLSIAAMRENVELPSATISPAPGAANRGLAKMQRAFDSARSPASVKKARNHRRN